MNFANLSWEQFELLCARLLQAEGFSLLAHSGRSRDIGVDFLVSPPGGGQKWVVEWKLTHRPVAATPIIRKGVQQLLAAQELLGADRLLLIISADLPASLADWIGKQGYFHLWDRTVLLELLEKHFYIRAEFEALIDSQQKIQEKVFDPLSQDRRARELIERLAALNPGQDSWREYEDLCVDILNHVFIPPLRTPRIQTRSEDGLDRRDAIYTIDNGHVFWDNLKNECRTRILVAEFKNHQSTPSQKEIESIQQYLFTKAMRSFGILCARQPPDESALKARRRAWMEFDKLVVFLADQDLQEILLLKAAGDDPTEVINSQLDDFFIRLCP